MKQTSLFILFVTVSACALAQKSPFSKLAEAQGQYEQGKYKKALRTLYRAENKNYGSAVFCGNALMDYDRESNLLRSTIFIEQGKYDQARNALNSIMFELSSDNLDSIRIRTYQLEFGGDSLNGMFDFSLTSTAIECPDKLNCFALLPLSNGTQMRFKIPGRYNFILGSDCDQDTKLSMWMDEFRQSNNMGLIGAKNGE